MGPELNDKIGFRMIKCDIVMHSKVKTEFWMPQWDIRPEFECWNRNCYIQPNSNDKIGYQTSKCDNRPDFESQNTCRIIRYLAEVLQPYSDVNVGIGRQTPWWPRPKAIHLSWLGPELSSVAWSTGAQLIIFFFSRFSVVLFDRPGISISHAAHCVCRVLVFASS